MYQQLIEEFIQQEQLPPSYLTDATQCFLPLLHELELQIRKQKNGPYLIGINGAQGTGKSTLAKLICSLLAQSGYQVANLSIDDFYYSQSKRQELATQVHPLLLSRGVPGTHDVALALSIMKQLCEAGPKQQIRLPGFDKSIDDCRPLQDCDTLCGPINAVVLEGWFVGAEGQTAEELAQPSNELEANYDADGRWRSYVNEQLVSAYQPLFEKLDTLVMLQAPGFEQVLEWRCLQEEKLRDQVAENASGLMDREAIERFIQHFERLTRHCLLTLPGTADWVFRLDGQHRIYPSGG